MNKHKKWYLIIGFCFLLILLVSGCSNQSSTVETQDNQDTFKIGIDEYYPPYGYRERDRYIGFDIDLARIVAERLGKELEVIPINWNEKDTLLNEGKIDAIWNGFTFTEEREEEYSLTDPYIRNSVVLVVRDDSTISNKNELVDKVVGVQDDSSEEEVFKAQPIYDSIDHLTLFQENQSALKNLYVGLTDAVVVDYVLANWYMKEKGSSYKIVDTFQEMLITVAFAKDNTKLRDQVNEILKELKDTGVIAELSNQWFGQDLTNYSN